MTLHIQHIIQQLFRAGSLEDVPRERLEALVEEYPSFSIARYLLSSKLRAENADNFAEETRKTNLYFTNPLWLQWLLQQASVASEQVPAVEIAMPVEEYIEQAFDVQGDHKVVELYLEQPLVEEAGQAPAEQPFEAPIVAQQPEQAAEEPGEKEERIVEPSLVFESYHMVDYFASQGIKLALDENPSDRLGKQMKSFTDWLKVMKRLPQKEGGTVPDRIAEDKVHAIAAHSIEGREVVTETMAEVLAKQGMWEKASEVYRKLSLLNPGKSGYFAAKIEQLKMN